MTTGVNPHCERSPAHTPSLAHLQHTIARSEATWQSTKPSQEGYGWQRSHKLRPLRETLDRHASLAMTKYKFVIQSKQKPI